MLHGDDALTSWRLAGVDHACASQPGQQIAARSARSRLQRRIGHAASPAARQTSTTRWMPFWVPECRHLTSTPTMAQPTARATATVFSKPSY